MYVTDIEKLRKCLVHNLQSYVLKLQPFGLNCCLVGYKVDFGKKNANLRDQGETI